jgi:nucleotide-binding universal stress UspA family protein
MFKNILVPLDGSKLAEAALPPAASLAQTLNAPVTLLHVIEENPPQEVHHDRHLTESEEAAAYLKDVAGRAFPKSVQVKSHVHTAEVKDVAASIIQHANEEFNPDLIVMCAHGQSGFRDLIFGGIAQQVLAGRLTPLLLLQPKIAESRPFALRRILVPLDSESMHDTSLPYAELLAKAYGAEIDLLTVVPTYATLTGQKAAASSMLPATATALLEIKEQAAKAHLQNHCDELLRAGCTAKAQIARGGAATMIVKTAKKLGADLIVLSTHRKAGIDAFWAHSVTPNVVRKTQIPLLLLPLSE